jgi:hypothetical protein
MSDKTFSSPVRISIGAMGLRFVASAWEALECLRNQWPQPEGLEYKRAVRICRDALEGWMSPAKARQAFVKAAQRAGILIDDPASGQAATPQLLLNRRSAKLRRTAGR